MTITLPDCAASFPRSLRYPLRLASRSRAVLESRRPFRDAPFSERHLQCVWFDPALRPARLKTQEGEDVTVEDPGIWNLEAGPDFVGAALRVGPGRRRVSGDVEVHVHPADWSRHAHADDPLYRRVRFHVTYFPGPAAASSPPPGTIGIPLRDALAAHSSFAFEGVDLAAYPFAVRTTPTPCSRALAAWSPAERTALLDAAGEERMRRKAERLALAMRENGADQALYAEVLCALGYKHNKAPFRRLAAGVPLGELREAARGKRAAAYAILLGVAGLLPERLDPRWDAETRSFVRRLWDAWWKCSERFAGRGIPSAHWRLSNLRPANHPARRLMAAAALFAADHAIGEHWLKLAAGRGDPVDRLCRALERARCPYWSHRLSLGGERRAEPIALIGESRARAIALNVFVPFLAAARPSEALRRERLDRLPAEEGSGIVRQTALSLFGPDHSTALYRGGLRRQGLVQIFHDFCLNDRSRCASCSLPGLLARYEAGNAGAPPGRHTA